MLNGRLWRGCGRNRCTKNVEWEIILQNERPHTRWLNNMVMDLVVPGSVAGEKEYEIEQAGGELYGKPKPTRGCSAEDDKIYIKNV
jgi:hypothetical protein